MFKLEWQTRTLASFTAATAFTDAKGMRSLQEAVQQIHLLPHEEGPPEPEAGSAERLMALFRPDLQGG